MGSGSCFLFSYLQAGPGPSFSPCLPASSQDTKVEQLTGAERGTCCGWGMELLASHPTAPPRMGLQDPSRSSPRKLGEAWSCVFSHTAGRQARQLQAVTLPVSHPLHLGEDPKQRGRGGCILTIPAHLQQLAQTLQPQDHLLSGECLGPHSFPVRCWASQGRPGSQGFLGIPWGG